MNKIRRWFALSWFGKWEREKRKAKRQWESFSPEYQQEMLDLADKILDEVIEEEKEAKL